MITHISNRHLELEPVLGDLARDAKLVCYSQSDGDTESVLFKEASHWVAMAREEEDLGDVPGDPRWQLCETNSETDKVWTDDFSNLLSTFEWR